MAHDSGGPSAATRRASKRRPQKAPPLQQALQGVVRGVSHGAQQASRNLPARPPTPPLGRNLEGVVRGVAKTGRQAEKQAKKNPSTFYSLNDKKLIALLPGVLEALGGHRSSMQPAMSPLTISSAVNTLPGFKSVYDPIARQYEDYMRQVYSKERPYLPGAGPKAPPLGLEGSIPSEQGLVEHTGFGPPGKRHVSYSYEDAVFGTTPPGNPNQATNFLSMFAKDAPVHEFAHAFQRDTPSQYRQDPGLYEGGAEAFNRAVAPKLGLGLIVRTTPLYQQYVNRLKRTRSPAYILKGQFGG